MGIKRKLKSRNQTRNQHKLDRKRMAKMFDSYRTIRNIAAMYQAMNDLSFYKRIDGKFFPEELDQ